MIAEASAPAKIILCGEHAVVYGQPAIAIPIPTLRARAVAYEPDSIGQGLKIQAVDLGQELYLNNIENFDRGNPLLLAAHLFLARFGRLVPDITIELTSDIPVASGLGSGAAITTAFLRVLISILRQPVENGTLNEIVYEVEKFHHGTPSGIDNSVIVYERPVYFVRNQPIEWLPIGMKLTFLIGDTGIAASTYEAVSAVRLLYEANRSEVKGTIDSIGRIVVGIRQAIDSGDAGEIGQLMTENHRLLQQLTVSSTKLDTLVDAALSAGAIGAKLSGGGRGGNMISAVHEQDVSSIRDALFSAGASQVFEVRLS